MVLREFCCDAVVGRNQVLPAIVFLAVGRRRRRTAPMKQVVSPVERRDKSLRSWSWFRSEGEPGGRRPCSSWAHSATTAVFGDISGCPMPPYLSISIAKSIARGSLRLLLCHSAGASSTLHRRRDRSHSRLAVMHRRLLTGAKSRPTSLT